MAVLKMHHNVQGAALWPRLSIPGVRMQFTVAKISRKNLMLRVLCRFACKQRDYCLTRPSWFTRPKIDDDCLCPPEPTALQKRISFPHFGINLQHASPGAPPFCMFSLQSSTAGRYLSTCVGRLKELPTPPLPFH